MSVTGGEPPEPSDDGEVLGVLTGQVPIRPTPSEDDTDEENEDG